MHLYYSADTHARYVHYEVKGVLRGELWMTTHKMPSHICQQVS